MKKQTIFAAMWLITYVALLTLFITNFQEVRELFSSFLSLISPLIIGFALAFILNRPCQIFQGWYLKVPGLKKLPGLFLGLAVVSSYLMLTLAIAAIVGFVVPQFIDSVSVFWASLEGYLYNIQGTLNTLLSRLSLETLDLSSITTNLDNILNNIANSALSMATTTFNHVVTITGAVISMAITVVMAFVFSIYFLAGKENLIRQASRVGHAYLPKSWVTPIHEVITLTAETFTRFIAGQVTEAFILGGLCSLGMLFLYADYAALIGVIVGCTALVPVVGAYVGAFISAALLLMVSPLTALAFLIFIGILQQIESNVIYPRVVGASIGLPGLWVLAAVMIGGGIGGIPGILLSVPVASVAYTLFKKNIRKRLGDTDAEEPPVMPPPDSQEQ